MSGQPFISWNNREGHTLNRRARKTWKQTKVRCGYCGGWITDGACRDCRKPAAADAVLRVIGGEK